MTGLRGLVALSLLAVVAGCGTGAGTVAAPPAAPTSAGCPEQVTLGEADNGGTFCVARGGMIVVVLRGAPGQPWRPIQASGAALAGVTNPPAPTPSGSADVVGAYLAVQAGAVRITSSRSACPPPSPGSVACHAIQAYEVAVTVS